MTVQPLAGEDPNFSQESYLNRIYRVCPLELHTIVKIKKFMIIHPKWEAADDHF